MGRSKGAAARRRKADAAKKAYAPKINVAAAPKINVAEVPRAVPRLVPDVLANIHDRLGFLDRVAFAAVFAASCDGDLFMTHVPWLLLTSKDNTKKATVELFSIADRRGATVPAPDPAMRDHMSVGSNRGWLATAHDRGQMYLVNPATGEQHELPDLSTMGVFRPRNGPYFTLEFDPFMTIRYGHGPPFEHHHWCNTVTWSSYMTRSLMYRKVVLSSSPSPRTYADMLISGRDFGAPAFASAEDPAWRLAASPDGIEDAIHHDGQFYSVSHAGLVEAWERDAESGAYTSTSAAPRLDVEQQPHCRKYLAAAPGGRLMVVTKWMRMCSFKVHVLCDDDGQYWKEARDVGDLALFVGMNNTLCVPTIGRTQIKADCVYYTDDLIESFTSESWCRSPDRSSRFQAVGVYNLVDGTVKKIEALERDERSFRGPLPVWIT